MSFPMSKEHQEKLKDIKDDIENSYIWFTNNYKRYHESYKFVFETSLSPADIEKLKLMNKPVVEFPILEAQISRLRGEFSKQQPEIDVRAAEGVALERLTPQYLQLLKVLQAHLNEVFFEANNNEFEYDIYSDTLGGGFSVAKVYTDYTNDESFLQTIKVQRCFNPTMCGFDPLSKTSHKGDGRYCFELYPMTEEEFKQEFGAEKAKKIKFSKSLRDFNWSYRNNDQKIILVADFYIKVAKKVKLYLLPDNKTMTSREYDEMIENWDKIEQPPVVLDERKSTKTVIHRYQICENEVLEHEETDYPMLPLVFFDGNSVMIQNSQGGAMEQLCRPYTFHARGIQRLLNVAGQAVGGEIEDMVMHKFKVPLEAIPPQYLDMYTKPSIAGTLVYNQFDPKRPDVRLDPPMEIQRTATPPILEQTFMMSPEMTQTILGNYDAILGINGKDISGKAIQQGAMQSNAAAMPYLVGFIKGLQRCAEIVINLIPLYYTTPRTLPIRTASGKREYVVVNDEESESSVMFNYDPHELQVRIEPGVNIEVQKQIAMEQLIGLMEVSPTFGEFMNSQGLPILLDNISIRGIEGLKEMAEQFLEAKSQQEPPPSESEIQAQTIMQVEGMKVQQRQLEADGKLAVQSAEVAVKKQAADTDQIRLMAEIGAKHLAEQLAHEREDAKIAQGAVEFAAGHALERARLEHEKEQASQQQQPEM